MSPSAPWLELLLKSPVVATVLAGLVVWRYQHYVTKRERRSLLSLECGFGKKVSDVGQFLGCVLEGLRRPEVVPQLHRPKGWAERVLSCPGWLRTGPDWLQQLSDADHLVALSTAVGMPNAFVKGTRALRRATAEWQRRAQSVASASHEDPTERRRSLLEAEESRELVEWAERADVEFRAAYEMEDILVRWEGWPLGRRGVNRQLCRALKSICKLAEEVDHKLGAGCSS